MRPSEFFSDGRGYECVRYDLCFIENAQRPEGTPKINTCHENCPMGKREGVIACVNYWEAKEKRALEEALFYQRMALRAEKQL